jgi:hypothetical protein
LAKKQKEAEAKEREDRAQLDDTVTTAVFLIAIKKIFLT